MWPKLDYIDEYDGHKTDKKEYILTITNITSKSVYRIRIDWNFTETGVYIYMYMNIVIYNTLIIHVLKKM